MANIFNRYYKQYDSWYDKNKFVFLSELKAIRKALPKTGKGLEIGVGTGQFASALRVKYGIDPSANMLKLAQQRGIKTKLGYGESLPYRNCTFDYVLIVFTLCFVKNHGKVLKEAKRVLKKNGKIIIGMIEKRSFLGEHYKKTKSVFYKHANFFSAGELTELLATIGFNQFSYYQTLYAVPDAIKSTERPSKGLGKGGFIVLSAYKS